MLNRLREFFLLLPDGSVKKILFAIVIMLFVFFPLGMIYVHNIDDNLNFGKTTVDKNSPSKAVAVAINLIDREINTHEWTPNDPFFLPGAWLDRMPAYQKGISSALSRFAVEMGDQIGRTRGSSEIDADLEKAGGMLKYPPDIWFWNVSVSLMPMASSEKQYLGAMKALQRYNNRLETGKAIFERRADNLQATLERIESDLGSASAALANRIHDPSIVDTGSDVLLYDVKGRMYAYTLILEGLRQDFAQVITEKQLGQSWDQMQSSMADGAELGTFLVFNNAPDSQFFPNHLSAMGFYLLRARTQMKEVSNILLK